MVFHQVFKATLLTVFVSFLFACGSKSECHDCVGGLLPMPTPTPASNDSRLVDVSSEVDITTVASYYSLYEYGSTQKFYHFLDDQIVLTVHVDNASNDFSAGVEVSVNVFNKSETIGSIDKWINNQHSDGLYGDAPEPVSTFSLPENKYSIVSSALIDHTVEDSGNEYDNYMLEIYIDDYIQESIDNADIHILNFTVETNVHVITNDGYAFNPAASNVVKTEIVTYPTLLNTYGPTLQFYSFPGVQKVLVLRIDNTSADFSVSLEMKAFGYGVSDELIQGWISNQTAEAPMDAAEPIDTFVFPDNAYVVTSSDVLVQFVGNLGDEYDRYTVEITSETVGLYQWYSVVGTVYNANVYVMTKDVD